MRKCGDCQLCCRLIPVEELHKPASTRCKNQKHGVGCAIYATRPWSCQLWTCAWLVGAPVGQRPDRSGFVVDVGLDYVTASDEVKGVKDIKIPCIQVWCDESDTKDTWDTPELRAFIAEMGRTRGLSCIVRYGQKHGVFICPPEIRDSDTGGIHTMNKGEWFIYRIGAPRDHEHSAAEKAEVLGRRPFL